MADESTSNKKPKLEVVSRPVSEADIEPFCALSELEYAGEMITVSEFVIWKHMGAPDGPSTAVELTDGAAVMGRLWNQRRRWRVGGREVTAANPIDMVIRPKARSLPALLRMLKGAYAVGAEESDVVFHTSSPTTDLMYRRFMHLSPVANFDGAVIPLRPVRAWRMMQKASRTPLDTIVDAAFSRLVGALGAVGRSRLELVESVSAEDENRIFAAFQAEEPVASVRDRSWREWRMGDDVAPGYSFRWIVFGGRPVGWIALADRDIDGLRARFVLDVALPQMKSGRPARALWTVVAADAARAGRDAVFLLANLEGNARLARLATLPMFRVDRSRLPQEVPLFVRWSDESAPPQADLGAGYWTMADFDMI